jgi:hypothetical protein
MLISSPPTIQVAENADSLWCLWQLKQSKEWKVPPALAVNWSLHLFKALSHLHALSSPIMRESPASMCSVYKRNQLSTLCGSVQIHALGDISSRYILHQL